MLQEEQEYSAILSTFIKLPFVIKIFVSSIFEHPFNAGFTAFQLNIPTTCTSKSDRVCHLTILLHMSLSYLGHGVRKSAFVAREH